jgi:hypothetical protein
VYGGRNQGLSARTLDQKHLKIQNAKITDANITRKTIRYRVLSAYESHKDKVMAVVEAVMRPDSRLF